MAYGGNGNRGAFDLTINWVFCSLALAAVTLRLMSGRMRKYTKWDMGDAFIVFAMALVLAKTIYVTVCVHYGFGQHFDIILATNPAIIPKLSRLVYILNAISLWTWVWPKFPVVILLVQLFGTRDKKLAPVLWSLLVFLVGWNIMMTVITFEQCNPIQKNWDPTLPGSCWNGNIYLDLGYFITAYSAALDMSFAIYPAVRIYQLQMDRSKKILIACSMALGIPAGCVTIVKATQIKETIESGDPTWASIPLDCWNQVESSLLLLAAAIPKITPVMALLGTQIMSIVSSLSSGSFSRRSEHSDLGKESKVKSRMFARGRSREMTVASDDSTEVDVDTTRADRRSNDII